MEKTRLYVGNLPQYVDEDFIRNRFSKYGEVLSVELKRRNSCLDENDILSSFAFVDIKSSEANLTKCIKKLSLKKWLNNQVTIQLARQSVISRLENERIDSKNMVEKTNLNKSETPSGNALQKKNLKKSFTEDINLSNSISHKFEDFNDEKYSDDKTNVVETRCNEQISISDTSKETDPHYTNDNENNFKQKFNSTVNSTKANIVESSSVSNNILRQLAKLSDAKRLKSVEELKNVLDQRKQAVKRALSSVDSSMLNKKIVFGDDDDNMESNTNDRKRSKTDTPNGNAQLFDEDSDDNANVTSYEFNLKKQYDGAKGKKLLELRSKFGNDRRFLLDERFYESDEDKNNEGGVNNNEESRSKELDNTESTEDEIKNQLEILQSVVGDVKLSRDKKKQKIEKPSLSMVGVRFDPSIPDHERFIVKPSEVDDDGDDELKKKKRKEKRKKHGVNEEESSVNKAPDISKETYYEVADDLKNTFKSTEKGTFSFSDMFKSSSGKSGNRNEENSMLKKLNSHRDAPYNKFDDDRFGGDFNQKEENFPSTRNSMQIKQTPRDLLNEKFFYCRNDHRFKEAHDFFSKYAEPENQNFKEARLELKKIIKKKVMSKTRKENLFKKKVGVSRASNFRKNFKRRKNFNKNHI